MKGANLKDFFEFCDVEWSELRHVPTKTLKGLQVVGGMS